MMRREISIVALWTLGTLGAAAFLAPSSLTASDPAVTPQAVVEVDGVTLSLLPKPELAAGQKPSVVLLAKNNSNKPATAAYSLRMLADPPVSPWSRMVPTPKTVWHTKGSVQLAAGESREITIATDTDIPQGNNATFLLAPAAAPQNAIRALTLPGAATIAQGNVPQLVVQVEPQPLVESGSE